MTRPESKELLARVPGKYMRKMRTHDEYMVEILKDPKEAALYLSVVAEENDPAHMLMALSRVARAHGMSKLAAKISISRMGIHKALSKKGNPGFRTFLGILKASGLR